MPRFNIGDSISWGKLVVMEILNIADGKYCIRSLTDEDPEPELVDIEELDAVAEFVPPLEISYYKFIKIIHVKALSKTHIFAVVNKNSGTQLGEIRWYASWRCYVFLNSTDIILSAGCMEDIIGFIKMAEEWRKK